MLDNNNVTATNEATPGPSSSSDAALTAAPAPQNGAKRKRRPAGTPDPDAEVVSLSPRTLLESDRYVCEFCGQGFQREQNLQMHRRRHKVPWKASKRGAETAAAGKKRVYVCPEPSCLHHDARHALGDLVGIKKHYRRKHSNSKQWVCEKCSKGYAVQSDYKAHLKTCGTRGHSCDCGRVFSRVESFIEHQDACAAKRNNGTDTQQPLLVLHQPICSSTTPSATSPSSDTNFSTAVPPLPTPTPLTIPPPPPAEPPISDSHHKKHTRLELQLLPSSPAFPALEDNHATGLNLSIGGAGRKSGAAVMSEEVRMAMAEKSYAEETRQDARRQTELAELEFASAKRIREAAKAELEKAQVLKEQAAEKISAIMLEITCRACKQKLSEDNAGFRLRLDG
ncbi:zinc finger protein SHOOT GRAVITROPISM 5 [Ipomoea triloba]|uniref:zinc finger protein SHOOT GRAVITROPISM 5 n=1 Tax=Ipomoea triloba TaxID=35885 RepID=UPI00125CF989|nr:zinc finger protein SHOOT GRAVITROPISM 5 [Ipomoea triloba]